MSRWLLVLALITACSPSGPQEAPADLTSGISTDTHPAAAPPAPAPSATEGPKLMPVDEGVRDPEFAEFRDELLAIVTRRDREALMERVDPNIRTSFGGGGGAADFRRQWKLDTNSSPLWEELEQILKLGGSFNPDSRERQFWAPYVHSTWPANIDAFRAVAVIDEDVPLHQAPDAGSPLIGRLSFDAVSTEDVPAAQLRSGWVRVTTHDGRSGWVESRFVRSPIGYRAGFSRRSGEWKLTALVSGD